MGTGIGFGFSVAVLLSYLIKLLYIVFVIGLVGGLVSIVKNNIFTQEDIENFKAPFKGKKANKKSCTACGKEVNEEWKACPHCGTVIEE